MFTREQLLEKHVAMLCGGLSAEREVSLNTGAACAKALREKGYRVHEIDVGRDIAAVLREQAIDVAYIGLHGTFGEDGCIQGLLETLGIPYTGSGVLSSALAMDKLVSKQLFNDCGIPTAPHIVVSRDGPRPLPSFGLPAVVKPNSEGSSVGITIVHEQSDYQAALDTALTCDERVLVEQFVAGRELTVGVLDGEALETLEIVVKQCAFYDYKAKYLVDDNSYLTPAPIDDELRDWLLQQGAAAHQALLCHGASRVDFLVPKAPKADEPPAYVLEVNTLPGMTAASLLPKIAAARGLSFADLCERILLSARCEKTAVHKSE